MRFVRKFIVDGGFVGILQGGGNVVTDIRDFVQQVKRANDIVDVIGSYLELRQKGTTHWARCPFHGEKTPSFSVNRNLQIYKCFGCGESGDVIKFVEKYESCTFMEAVEILAKRVNMKMPETSFQRQDREFSERKKKRDLYMDICRDTAVFYYKTYYSPKGAQAREYVEKRGFTVDTAKKFGMGFSPDRFSLVKYLTEKKYALDDCAKCGVLAKNAKGEYFDALSYRLIIPIFNMQGKVIAFGGRGMDERTISFGKYKNTSDTPIFTKKDNLFALNIAKEQKQQTALPNIVVVEGYMDVIAMYQAGFARAVASMGTSLTENQAKWLSRLTDTVYICYDGDAAGQKATVRGMDILDKAGLEVKVMSVPEKLDPDEYIKKYGKDAFEQLIDKALPLPDYKLQILKNAYPIDSKDPSKRNDALAKYVKGAIVMLKQLDDVRQAQYVSAVSLITGYSQEYFRRKLAGETTDEPQTDSGGQLSPETQAKYFVAASLLRREQPLDVLSDKPLCYTAFLSNIYDYLSQCKSSGAEPSLDMLYTVCPDAGEIEYSRIIDVDFSPQKKEVNAKFFEECLRLIQVEKLKTEQEELTKKYKETQDGELLVRLAELSKKITEKNSPKN